jgi:hypothetical protein
MAGPLEPFLGVLLLRGSSLSSFLLGNAARPLGRDVVVRMNPRVSGELGTGHRERLVDRTVVPDQRIGVQHVGPQHGAASFRSNGQVAQPGKVRTAARYDVAQVQQEGQDARTAGHVH